MKTKEELLKEIENELKSWLFDSNMPYPILSHLKKVPDDIGTFAVGMKDNTVSFIYDNKGVAEKLDKDGLRFVLLHESYHLFLGHLTRLKGLNMNIANIAADICCNELIKNEYNSNLILEDALTLNDIPEYKGKIVFEDIYEYIKDKDNEKNSGDSDSKGGNSSDSDSKDENSGDSDSKDRSSDKGGSSSDKSESSSDKGRSSGPFSDRLKDYLSGKKEYPKHKELNDFEKAFIEELINSLRNRGLLGSKIERLIQISRSTKKYSISEVLEGEEKFNSSLKRKCLRPHRKFYEDIAFKGHIKRQNQINILLDTSGSMSNEILSKLLSKLDLDAKIYIVYCDAKVTGAEYLKSRKKIKVIGGGGTVLMEGIEYLIDKKMHIYPTFILTDGHTDELDLEKFSSVMILSSEVHPPIKSKSKGFFKSFIVKV